jgi:hypothetical protein
MMEGDLGAITMRRKRDRDDRFEAARGFRDPCVLDGATARVPDRRRTQPTC